MNWEPFIDAETGYITRYGMISPPYRIGKFIMSGEVKPQYGLWHERELLGYFHTFEEAQQAAEKHSGVQQVMDGRT